MLLALCLALAADPVRLGGDELRHASYDPAGVAMSRDGKTVASVGRCRARVFSAADGRLLREVAVDDFTEFGMAVSADGRFAALLGSLRTDDPDERAESVRILDLTTGKSARVLDRPRHNGRGNGAAVALSPTGSHVASLTPEGVLRVEDTSTGEVVGVLPLKVDTPHIAFSPDGEAVAVVGWDKTVRVWRWKTGKDPKAINAGKAPIRSVAFSPDGKRLAFHVPEDETVRVVDVATGKLVGVPRPPSKAATPSLPTFSPDGKYLAASLLTGGVALWDAKTLEPRGVVAVPGYVHRVAFSPDGKRLLTQDASGVRVFDAATRKEVVAPSPQRLLPTSLALARDGTAMTMAGTFSRARRGTPVNLWDASSGRLRLSVAVTWGTPVTAALSDDGLTLAVATENETCVRLVDARTGRTRLTLALPDGLVGAEQALSFSPDGSRLRWWGKEMRLRTWIVADGRVVADAELMPGGKPAARQLSTISAHASGGYSRDGRFVVAGSRDLFRRVSAVGVFDAATGAERAGVTGADVAASVLSPDGSRLLLTRVKNRAAFLELRDGATGRLLHEAELTHTDAGPALFAPAGAWLAVGSSWHGGTKSQVAFYDAAGGKYRGGIDVKGRVLSLAASPDGRKIVAGFEDGSATVYDVP